MPRRQGQEEVLTFVAQVINIIEQSGGRVFLCKKSTVNTHLSLSGRLPSRAGSALGVRRGLDVAQD